MNTGSPGSSDRHEPQTPVFRWNLRQHSSAVTPSKGVARVAKHNHSP